MKRLTAALTVLLIALLPGCAQQASAKERITQAPAAVAEQGSARMAMTMEMLGGAQDVTVKGDGAVDFASQSASMTMDLGGMGAQAGMGQMEMISEGTIAYFKFPNHEQMGIPTPWVKMDLEKMTGLAGMDSLQQMNNDPAKQMEMLRGVSDDIEEVGTEEIRGTSTTHYRATINVDKALEEMPEEARDSFSEVYEQLGVDTIPAEVWIDDEGLLRRQKITMDMSNAEGIAAAGGQAPTEMVIDMEFYDFGADVDVEPPPADQVTDFAELQQGAGGG